jgi:hypothetical protein
LMYIIICIQTENEKTRLSIKWLQVFPTVP